MTASAPAGNGAPVMIRAACPRERVIDGAVPAGISPMTGRMTGLSGEAPVRSNAITANPSILELTKIGKSRGDAMSSAKTRLSAVSYTHLRAHETVLDLVCRL